MPYTGSSTMFHRHGIQGQHTDTRLAEYHAWHVSSTLLFPCCLKLFLYSYHQDNILLKLLLLHKRLLHLYYHTQILNHKGNQLWPCWYLYFSQTVSEGYPLLQTYLPREEIQSYQEFAVHHKIQ